MSSAKLKPSFSSVGQSVAGLPTFSPRHNLPLEYPAMAPPRGLNPTTSLFRNHHQGEFLSLLYALNDKPLFLWEKQLRSGHIKRINDPEIRSLTIEILSPNVATTFITAPPEPAQSLGIRLPILVMVVKNLRRYFMFELQIFDDTRTRRRLVFTNFSQGPKVRPFSATLPLVLEDGWNQVTVNLHEIIRQIYGTEYKETVRIQVHPNCRIRRIYFVDRVTNDDRKEFKGVVNDVNLEEVVETVEPLEEVIVVTASTANPDDLVPAGADS